VIDALPPVFNQKNEYERISSIIFVECANNEYLLNFQMILKNSPKLPIYAFPFLVGTIFENRGKTLYEIGNEG